MTQKSDNLLGNVSRAVKEPAKISLIIISGLIFLASILAEEPRAVEQSIHEDKSASDVGRSASLYPNFAGYARKITTDSAEAQAMVRPSYSTAIWLQP